MGSIDREKVIDHFSDCCDIAAANGNGWVLVRTDMLHEALDMLEPRVLTLEEAQSVDYCWYESRTANVCILCSAYMATNRNGKSKTEFEQMGSPIRGFQYDETYGISWRCWSSKPTDEQREATPWDD